MPRTRSYNAHSGIIQRVRGILKACYISVSSIGAIPTRTARQYQFLIRYQNQSINFNVFGIVSKISRKQGESKRKEKKTIDGRLI